MTPDGSAASQRVVAVVPVGQLEGAKSRLGGSLDAEERYDLVVAMVRRTLAAVAATPGIAETIVVTPDDEVRTVALEAGARPIRQRSRGLNQGLREARDEAIAGGADAILAVPIDLPLVSPAALEALLTPLTDPARPLVVMTPDRHGRGTNALLLAPPDAIDFAFGGDSRVAHASRARAAGARLLEIHGPLRLDLDTPEDVLLVEDIAPEAADVH